MPIIRQYQDTTDRIQVVELWRNVFGYETAHNEPNLSISKKIATKDGLFCMKVKLQLLSANEATAAFYKSLGYSVEPNISLGKVL